MRSQIRPSTAFVSRIIGATLVSAFMVMAITACETYNPFSAAETLEQRSFAAEGAYNIALQSALDLINDPAVPQSSKAKIAAAEAQATPIINNLAQTTDQYIAAQRALAAGTTTEDKVTIVANNLESWILQAEAAIRSMSSLIDSIKDG